jgi:hypothetical protein
MPNKKLTTAVAETLEDGAIQVEVTLPVRPRRQEGPKGGHPDGNSEVESRSRMPRITRLMALAIKFDAMVENGEVRDYADLARLGYVTRARITQIMNLLNLAPDIQYAILKGTAELGITERHARCMTRVVLWDDQRTLFHGAGRLSKSN